LLWKYLGNWQTWKANKISKRSEDSVPIQFPKLEDCWSECGYVRALVRGLVQYNKIHHFISYKFRYCHLHAASGTLTVLLY
jgi:hypothetical protein